MCEEAAGESWRERARELHEKGGVPRQRARVVALREAGRSFSEIARELGFGADGEDRSQVKFHVDAYSDQREEAAWLAEYGPEI